MHVSRTIKRNAFIVMLGFALYQTVCLFGARSHPVTNAAALKQQAVGLSKRFLHASDETVHIALTVDSSSYAMGLLAVLNSTMSNSATPDSIFFHVISTAQDNTELEDLIHSHFSRSHLRPHFKLHTLDLSEELHGQTLKVWGAYRSASLSKPIVYARFVLQKLFPELEKIIYLDQDILVLKDIRELWNQNLEGYPLAGARLCRAEFRRAFNFRQQILIDKGFDHNECILNNGVMLMNLTMWRQHNYTEELFFWAKKNSESKLYELGSQPPQNLVFYKNYKILDQRFNLMDLSGLRDIHKVPITVSPVAVMNAVIIHFNGNFKPWFGCPGYYSEIFEYYFPDFRNHVTIEQTDEVKNACSEVVWTKDKAMASDVEKFTVVIVSFKRRDNLLKISQHLHKSDFVQEILVAWNNQDEPCPPEIAPLARCVQQEANLVHNRFGIWPEVKTEAVLHYDDDIMVPLYDIEAAFKIWRSTRDQVLGFEPRVVFEDETQHVYRFMLHEGYFDLIIGKLFFIHRKYMQRYMETPSLLTLSTKAPCEDLAINFLVASETSLPGQLFKTNITEITSKYFAGLSQGIDSTIWRNERHNCIQNLIKIYNGVAVMPQRSYYEHHNEIDRTVKLKISEGFSWCSDKLGSRPCRQP